MRPTLAPNNDTPDRVIQLGLIGAGRWGQAYIRTLANCDGISLCHIASRNPKTKSLAPNGCTVSTDWQSLVNAGDIDGVIIATPPASHAEIALAAIEQGHAIMVEKPLTLSLPEAERLLHAAKTHQIVTLVDHTHLFHPAFSELKNQIRQNGPIQEIQTCAGQLGPFKDDTPVLWDWAPHDIAMCLDLTGQSIKNINVQKTSRPQQTDGERYELTLNFKDGLKAHIQVGNDFSKKTRLLTVFTGDQEYIFDDCATNSLVSKSLMSSSENRPKIINVEKTLSLTRAIQEFARKIRLNRIETDSIELGVEVVRILSQCQDILTAE